MKNAIHYSNGKPQALSLPVLSRPDAILELIRVCEAELRQLDQSPDKFNCGSLTKQARGARRSKPATVNGSLLVRLFVIANMGPNEFPGCFELCQDGLNRINSEFEKRTWKTSETLRASFERTNSPTTWDDFLAECRSAAIEIKSQRLTGEHKALFDKSTASAIQEFIFRAAIPHGEVINKSVVLDLVPEDYAARVEGMTEREFSFLLKDLETIYGLVAFNKESDQYEVRMLSDGEREEIVDMRQVLELFLVSQNATTEKSRTELVERLETKQRELRQITQQFSLAYPDEARLEIAHQFIAADMDFHLQFAGRRAFTRRSLRWLLRLLRIQKVNFRPMMDVDRMKKIIREHDVIVELLKQHPPRMLAIQHSMAEHIRQDGSVTTLAAGQIDSPPQLPG
ncbi:hypothetical protein OAH18_01280 [bacterium]|nr:hypothetical protein [bacterium]